MKRLAVLPILLLAGFSPVRAATATCNGLPVTITIAATGPVTQGTAGNDVVDATALQAGVIDLGEGDDTICVGDGLAHAIIGGAGRDTVSYERATTILIVRLEGRAGVGDAGSVTRLPRAAVTLPSTIPPTTTPSPTETKAGKDKLAQTEVFIGSPQSDVITGALLEADQIHGGAGDDTIIGLFGNDRLFGDAGNDIIFGDGADEVAYDPIREQQIGSVTKPSFATDDDYLDGGDGDDAINDETGANTMLGGAGNDAFSPGNQNDTVDGGTGRDVVSFPDNALTLNLNIVTPQDTGSGLDTIKNMEDVFGSAWNDVITGTYGQNLILGQDGDDTIYGYPTGSTDMRWDHLDGGVGNDRCRGLQTYNCETVLV